MESKLTGFAYPEPFPTPEFDRLHQMVLDRARANRSKVADHFSLSWNTLAARYLDCHETHVSFSSNVEQNGSSPPQPFRREQDRALFWFFVSLIAAMDHAAFAGYMCAALVDSSEFPIATEDDLRGITLAATTRRYQRHSQESGFPRSSAHG